jgi:tetratricopeptide (TPR) repeat protein
MSTILRVAVFFLMFFSCTLVCLSAQAGASDPKREMQAHLARAQQAVADKQFEAAIRELNAVLALDPKNVEARGNLGVVEFLQGNFASASQNLRQALRLQPSLWKAQAILGLCEKAQGRFDSAKTLLEKSFPHLQDKKLQIRAGMALAELDYQQGDLEKTSAVLAVLQKLDPTNVDVLYVVYRVHTDLATQARDSLALIAPNSARMHELLAQHLVTEGDAKGAIAQYREAVRIDPRLPGAHFELGEAILEDSMSEQSQQDAQKEFETALTVNPGDAKAESRLGALFSLHGDMDAALSHYRRAAELAPDDPEAQVGLGKVLMSAGQLDQALEHLRHAVAVDALDAQAHYRLSQAYRQLGRISEAASEVATFKQLREAKERLRSAYVHIYKESGNSQALNPDIPQ